MSIEWPTIIEGGIPILGRALCDRPRIWRHPLLPISAESARAEGPGSFPMAKAPSLCSLA
jgi:hypothetical protein